ncbi:MULTISPECIES: PEGA domain-containing protein [Vibrio]|uniref:PEGA domain-containing protein n=1 Tax=Vibrio TaxID=662 RepID=UPI001F1832BA|nr:MULTISPECIES: PEGA domain-containing protein [Vibrio]MCF7456269.1 PEGA domain-containing protein [Vibrio sp. A1-1]MCS0451066.1 PEGA domain-containing protein [Vibrio diabolicus]
MTKTNLLLILCLFSSHSYAESSILNEIRSSVIGEMVSKVVNYDIPFLKDFSYIPEMNQMRFMPTGGETILTLTDIDPEYDIYLFKKSTLLRAPYKPTPLSSGDYYLAFIKEGEIKSVRYLPVPQGMKSIYEIGTPHKTYNNQIPITIKTEPEDARIRIINIKERYSPQMLLTYGTYDLEVSKSGYHTYRRKIQINKNTPNWYISLKKLNE